jgi:hypothetical protein
MIKKGNIMNGITTGKLENGKYFYMDRSSNKPYLTFKEFNTSKELELFLKIHVDLVKKDEQEPSKTIEHTYPLREFKKWD